MKGIVFAGCSFTWGQGLHYYSDLPYLKPLEENKPSFDSDITTAHRKFIQSRRFAKIVASHFKTFEVVKLCNGGSDDDSLLFLDLLFSDKNGEPRTDWPEITNERYFYGDIERIVFQFTQPIRSGFHFELNGEKRRCLVAKKSFRDDYDDSSFLYKWLETNNIWYDEFYNSYKKQLFNRIKEKLIYYENLGIKTNVIIWTNEYDNVEEIQSDSWLQQRLVKLDFGNETYNTIHDLMENNKKLFIHHDVENVPFVTYDFHPSLFCHEIIAKNIIKKIESEIK